MITTLTICALSLITMLKWHSQSRTVAASIISPTTTPVGRFGYEDNSARIASLFKGSTHQKVDKDILNKEAVQIERLFLWKDFSKIRVISKLQVLIFAPELITQLTREVIISSARYVVHVSFMTDLREILYQKLDIIRRIICVLYFAASRRSVNNDNNGCVIQWQNSWFLPSPRGFDSFYTYQIH